MLKGGRRSRRGRILEGGRGKRRGVLGWRKGEEAKISRKPNRDKRINRDRHGSMERHLEKNKKRKSRDKAKQRVEWIQMIYGQFVERLALSGPVVTNET